MKTLPKELTVDQVLDLAYEIGKEVRGVGIFLPGCFLPFSIKLGKREAAGKLVSFVREILGDEQFDIAMQSTESPSAAGIRADIALIDVAMAEKGLELLTGPNANPQAFSKFAMAQSTFKVELQAKLDALNNVEEIVMAKALELFGVEETPRGLVDGDYRTDILVWGQQKTATLEKYGVEELILAPASLLKGYNNESRGFLKSHEDSIIVLTNGDDKWAAVASLPVHGENSTFFKVVARDLLGKETTDGVNGVKKYEGDSLPVVVK